MKPLAQLLAEVEEVTKKHTEHMDALQVQYGQAAKLLARGQHAAAMDGLLEVIRCDKNFRQGEPKLVILAVFALLGEEDPLTREYRDELASILF